MGNFIVTRVNARKVFFMGGKNFVFPTKPQRLIYCFLDTPRAPNYISPALKMRILITAATAVGAFFGAIGYGASDVPAANTGNLDFKQ